MPRTKGKEWDQVIIVEPESVNRVSGCKVRCKHCLLEFYAGATRIRDRFVHANPACGVSVKRCQMKCCN